MKILTNEEKETVEIRKKSGTNETLPSVNGWTNKPTWLVALWLDNDQGSHEELHRIIEESEDLDDAEDSLMEFVAVLIFGKDYDKVDGFTTDLLNWSLAYVNWSEIVANNLED